MNEERDRLHRQLIKLGDMMGDGLHYEPGGKWIEKEYGKIFNALYPEHKREARKLKAEKTNEQMKKLLEQCKCKECNGNLRQSRSGSKIAYCDNCNLRYQATTKRNGNS